EAAQVLEAITRGPTAELVDLAAGGTTAEQAAAAVRPKLAAGGTAGVVILGGYDVVPAHRLNVLDARSRQALTAAGLDGRDGDDFIVWSDEIYGDRDGDAMPEVPVSRIPDGRRSDVVFAALQAAPAARGPRFGVRNAKRSFAAAIFPRVPGAGGEMLVS